MAKSKKKTKTKAQAQPAAKAAVPDISLDIEKVINNSVLVATALSSTPPVLMKVCRLCGGKEGPFLNIFDQDQITAIKIDQLMPFRIEENDDLPHKICFRCSAKLEELHEFVSKCIRTQENLHDTMGRRPPVISKTNTRQMWEEKLNKSNLTNDDICNALIKKAMEGIKDIKDIPLSPPPQEKEEPATFQKKELKSKPGPLSKTAGLKSDKPGPMSKKEKSGQLAKNEIKKLEDENKEAKLKICKFDEPKRSTRSKAADKSDSSAEKKIRPSREATRPVIKESSSDEDNSDDVQEVTTNTNSKITDLTFDYDQGPHESQKKKKVEEPPKKTESEPPPKPFDIMEHVCMIKVNGVGVLFQCKLCNRNFLKKEVVQTHSCAKNGVPKVDLTKNLPPPEPPKITTVKYINTKVDQKKLPLKEEPVKPTEVKPKPKIGPASRVKHNYSDTEKNSNVTQPSPQPSPAPATGPPAAPVVNFPSMPGLNGRFRLVPGPNNTFTLMEDTGASNVSTALSTYMTNNITSQVSSNNPPSVPNLSKDESKKSRKRRPHNPEEERNNRSLLNVTHNSEQTGDSGPKDPRSRSFIDLVDLDDRPDQNNSVPELAGANDQPYPVGLFHTLSRVPQPPTFTTPAMKKQSYTVVQTGNPSKLLISTKPQAPVEEVPKKRPKKVKSQKSEQDSQEPATIENTSQAKDSSYFTFINVDPMSQSSYILPTDNIIQESQISTSTAVQAATAAPKDKDKYSCNMCNETFSREKKLLTHIQSHYSKMDEEDQLRAERSEPRRRKKS